MTNTYVVDRASLQEAVRVVNTFAPRRIQLPIMAGVLIEGDTVSRFDYETAVHVRLDNAVPLPKLLLNGKQLLDALKSFPKPKRGSSGSVTITVESSTVILSDGNLTFTLATLPAEDYPVIPKTPTGFLPLDESTHLSHADFQRLAAVTVAAGRDDTLPTLTGVKFTHEDGILAAAATDRYRLAEVRAQVPNHLPDVLVPARILAKIASAVAKQDPENSVFLLVENGAGDRRLHVFTGNLTVITRTLDGEFPKYQRLIPDLFSMTAVVDRVGYAQLVKSLTPMCERNTPMHFTFDEGALTAAAGAEEKSTMKIPCHLTDGDALGLDVAFNPAYLHDGLTFLTGAEVTVLGNLPTKPVLFRGDDPNAFYLLMPIRLTAGAGYRAAA